MAGEEAEAVRMLMTTQQYLMAPAKSMASMLLRSIARASGRAGAGAARGVASKANELADEGLSLLNGHGGLGLVRWERVRRGSTRSGHSINWLDLPADFAEYRALGEELRRHGVAASVVRDGDGLTLAFDGKDRQTVERALGIVLGSCLTSEERDAAVRPDDTPLEALPEKLTASGRDWERVDTDLGPAMHAVTQCKDGSELHQYAYPDGRNTVERVTPDGATTLVEESINRFNGPHSQSMGYLRDGMAMAAYAADANIDVAAVRRAQASAPAPSAHQQLARARAAKDFKDRRKKAPSVVRNIPAAKVAGPVRRGIKRV